MKNLAALLVGLVTCGGVAITATEPTDGSPAGANHIRLVIDYGDGVEKHFTALAWRDGMTVLDALQAAQKVSHGIQFVSRGQGEIAFVSQIDDLKNQGGGADGRNWVFSVNEKTADRSCGILQVRPGDRIAWRFGGLPPKK
ncbi:MAG: DUF4430 domain-containing protein [Pirellulales bacterium]|nr:DUF4430 domain-containing protein [Pirellulales bacterium]